VRAAPIAACPWIRLAARENVADNGNRSVNQNPDAVKFHQRDQMFDSQFLRTLARFQGRKSKIS
jgi:hypothetical protein